MVHGPGSSASASALDFAQLSIAEVYTADAAVVGLRVLHKLTLQSAVLGSSDATAVRLAPELVFSPQVQTLGFVTTRACREAPTVSSLQVIYTTTDPSICNTLLEPEIGEDGRPLESTEENEDDIVNSSNEDV